MELTEAEQTSLILQKSSSSLQSKIYSTKNIVEEIKNVQAKFLKDHDIHLVLKCAQMETSTAGKPGDFENVTLVPFQQLIQINQTIVREGQRKIVNTRKLISLKKTMNYKKWKKECSVTKLKNFRDHLAVLKSIKVMLLIT